ncbi:hypothetical protein BKN38_01650 [Helicobacter sp. CLO-3]|uniref:glutamyl-tRNA reductase n=1 Tax=unclassified Helicobacter TaxID=2593540 RepID=UPI0008055D10|nr:MULTISPECIES: glutamyl-tRNA reductase [unclassified Helicobacter]OBV29612.1 hypothetical protein BA723_04850 [Helicobacter sp. CLO-3]OHU85258.1 hypothetical protein BKN38_01650 [Helicobacter sp. CLO-3]
MQAQYLTLSFSHKTTPIALREKLSIAPDKLESFITHLKSKIPSINEIFLLSTCNRVEFYIITHAPQECVAGVLDVFARFVGVRLSELESACKSALGAEAVHHIFGVVSGLDSVVIGETQITGQVKSTYRMCFDLGVCGQEITRLVHFAFRTAAKVRNQTLISKTPLSVASIAVKKALESSAQNDALDSGARNSISNIGAQNPQNTRNAQNAPRAKRALIIGAGEIGQLVAKHLLESSVQISLINRSLCKAQDFAKSLESKNTEKCDSNKAESSQNAQQNTPQSALNPTRQTQKIQVLEWQNLAQIINEYDFVFSATSAQEPIITNDIYKPRDFKRIWLDLAVPRDIALDSSEENLEIVCVDDLKQVMNENLAHKKAQMHDAYRIIGEAVEEYFGWVQSLDVLPLIKALRQQAKDASLKELNRAIKKGYLPKEYEDEVRIILHNAFNVFLHNPTINLKDFAQNPEGDVIIEALQKVFEQKDKPKMLNRYKCEYDTTL